MRNCGGALLRALTRCGERARQAFDLASRQRSAAEAPDLALETNSIRGHGAVELRQQPVGNGERWVGANGAALYPDR